MQKPSCAGLGVVWKFSDEIQTVFLAAFVFNALQNMFAFCEKTTLVFLVWLYSSLFILFLIFLHFNVNK